MTREDQLKQAVRRLFKSWLETGREEVHQFLVDNGPDVTPAQVAEACPSCFGEQVVAEYHLAGLVSMGE